MKAIVVGATGATGRDLVNHLLMDKRVEKVTIFVRESVKLKHDKLITHIINFDDRSSWAHLVVGDVLFSCLGTTLKAAGTKEAQWLVDYTYQLNFAEAAAANGVPTYVLVSSANASPDSFFFYPKMKGMLEEEVKGLPFQSINIFQPSSLIRRGSDRKMENMGVSIIKTFNSIGLLRSYRPLPTEVLAQAMLHTAFDSLESPGSNTITNNEIFFIAKGGHTPFDD